MNEFEAISICKEGCWLYVVEVQRNGLHNFSMQYVKRTVRKRSVSKVRYVLYAYVRTRVHSS